MKVAIISDTHDNKAAVKRVLEMTLGAGVDLIVHCGDICSPEMVSLFKGRRASFVFGNGDVCRKELQQAIEEAACEWHERAAEVSEDGKVLCFTHGDNKAMLLHRIHSFKYDYFAYGHSHKAGQGMIGPTHCINPGSLRNTRKGTFAILDLKRGLCEMIQLSNSVHRGNNE